MTSSFRNFEELRQLGMKAYDNDHMASAVELVKCYLVHFPDDDKAWFAYGDALRVIGLYGAAAIALRNAEKLCPVDVKWTVQARLGLLFQDKGDRTSAERWYATALTSTEATKVSWLWVLRGANFAASELFDEAEHCHRQAIAVNCEDDEAYFNLGCVLLAKGQYKGAQCAAERALQLSPDYHEAFELMNRLEDVDQSQGFVEKVLRSEKGSELNSDD
jgi:tetratricopeptide (TPR) repeat protein